MNKKATLLVVSLSEAHFYSEHPFFACPIGRASILGARKVGCLDWNLSTPDMPLMLISGKEMSWYGHWIKKGKHRLKICSDVVPQPYFEGYLEIQEYCFSWYLNIFVWFQKLKLQLLRQNIRHFSWLIGTFEAENFDRC